MYWQLTILTLLLGCSAFISGAETALFNLSATQRHQFANTGNRLQRAAAELIHHPDRLILTLMFGNMAVNVAFFTISSLIVLRSVHRLPGWQSTLLGLAPLLAIILFGEVLPKALALAMPGTYSTAVALPLRMLHLFLAPVMKILQRGLIAPMMRLLAPEGAADDKPVTHEEIQALLDASAREGTLDRHTTNLLREVVELGDIKVREVMVPRIDIKAHNIDAPRARLVDLIRRERFGFVPIYAGDLDHILGVVSSSDVLLGADRPLHEMIRPVTYVPEIISIAALLTTLREKGQKHAITVDEYGGTAGLISIEDVVEEIVGELYDEDDSQPPVSEQIGPDSWLLPGNLPIRTWAESFRLRLAPRRLETLAGLMAASLGRLPAKGDTVVLGNLILTAREVRNRRVTQIELHRRDEAEAGGAS